MVIMETRFCIWFDRFELEIDSSGEVMNRDKLYIAEYDEDGKFIRRIESKYYGEPHEIPMDISVEEMESYDEYVCGDSIREVYDALERYLEEYYIEECVSPQTYWQPAEYAIVGLR